MHRRHRTTERLGDGTHCRECERAADDREAGELDGSTFQATAVMRLNRRAGIVTPLNRRSSGVAAGSRCVVASIDEGFDEDWVL